MNLRELGNPPEFIISEDNLNSIKYTSEILTMADSERKLKDLSDKVVEKSMKKGITIRLSHK